MVLKMLYRVKTMTQTLLANSKQEFYINLNIDEIDAYINSYKKKPEILISVEEVANGTFTEVYRNNSH